jgi:hypothetical protein
MAGSFLCQVGTSFRERANMEETGFDYFRDMFMHGEVRIKDNTYLILLMFSNFISLKFCPQCILAHAAH